MAGTVERTGTRCSIVRGVVAVLDWAAAGPAALATDRINTLQSSDDEVGVGIVSLLAGQGKVGSRDRPGAGSGADPNDVEYDA